MEPEGYDTLMIKRGKVMPLIELLAKAYNESEDEMIMIRPEATEEALFYLVQTGEKDG